MPRLALSHVLCRPQSFSISSRVLGVDQFGYVLGRLTSASILHLQGDSRKDISDMHKTIRQSIRKTFKMNHVIRKVCVVCVCASVCVMTFAIFFALFASSSQLCPTSFFYTHLRLQKRHQRSIRKCLRSLSDAPNNPLCGRWTSFSVYSSRLLLFLSQLGYAWLPRELCAFWQEIEVCWAQNRWPQSSSVAHNGVGWDLCANMRACASVSYVAICFDVLLFLCSDDLQAHKIDII